MGGCRTSGGNPGGRDVDARGTRGSTLEGLELAEGERYESVVVFDELLKGWWPEQGLKLSPHQSAAIEWSDLESFEAFADRTARVHVSFRVLAAETTFHEQQTRWATIYRCKVLEAERLPRSRRPGI